MNKRTVTMMRDLASITGKDPVTINELAKRYDVTARTIRNDLNEINSLLKENGLTELLLGSVGRISVMGDFPQVLSAVSTQDFYAYKLSKEERKMVAASMLIGKAGYVTLASVADRLYVSRATIIQDLDGIKEYIKEGGLKVTSHPNKGLLVEGKESDKRRFLYQLGRAGAGKEGAISGEAGQMISVTAGDTEVVRKILRDELRARCLRMTDTSFLKIQQYLGIMIARNLQGEYIEQTEERDPGKMELSRNILRYLCQYCGIRTTEDEVRYLSVLLKKCRYSRRQEFELDDVRIQIITRQFIHAVSEELLTDLDTDYDFFENLFNHLSSMFRSDASQFPENEELLKIVESHQEVRSAAFRNLHIIQEFNGQEISDAQLVYIVIHICAALERQKNGEVSFHVILACHVGVGTSKLLQERLKKHFQFQIVDIIPSHEAPELTEDAADLVISTVPLQKCRIETVVVSPMLRDEDYLKIGSALDTLREHRNLPERSGKQTVTAKGVMERISPIIEAAVPDAAGAEALLREIAREVRAYFQEQEEAGSWAEVPRLHHLLPPSHIQLDIRCENWRDAIRLSAEQLLNEGYISEEYVEGMIRNVEENGPYIVMAPGLAVPHDVPENGSLRLGMNLIRLNPPLPFDDEEPAEAEYVCALSAVDHNTHLKALFSLVNIFSDAECVERLRAARSPEEMADLFLQMEMNHTERVER